MLRGTFHYSVRAEFSSIEGTVTIRKSRQYKVAIFWVRFYRVLWSWVDEFCGPGLKALPTKKLKSTHSITGKDPRSDIDNLLSEL